MSSFLLSALFKAIGVEDWSSLIIVSIVEPSLNFQLTIISDIAFTTTELQSLNF
tara:strand:+ start:642 stop:803 length:162 start_codon:yes stop_codon:yes gene_type:complete